MPVASHSGQSSGSTSSGLATVRLLDACSLIFGFNISSRHCSLRSRGLRLKFNVSLNLLLLLVRLPNEVFGLPRWTKAKIRRRAKVEGRAK